MKKLLISLIALVGLSVSGLAFADGLGTGIKTVQSPHNFADNWCGGSAAGGGTLCSAHSPVILENDGDGNTATGAGWNQREEVCRVCHVPHDHNLNTQSYWTKGLLWNHATTAVTLWEPYDSGTMDATVGDPSGPSLLCLSCHDGTVAIDTFDKFATTAINITTQYRPDGAYQVPGPAVPLFGGNRDLRGTHPISMTYEFPTDTDLNDPAATAMGTSGNIADVLDGTGATATVECSSCHDVHDSDAVINTHLLRVSNNPSSDLCTTCHIK